MIAKLLISPSVEVRAGEIDQLLAVEKLSTNHPDVLFFDQNAKLGVEQAKQIRQHLSLKPYSAQGRAVVILSADNLTIEAQNALLKTLEEPPESALLILGASRDGLLLPTIISRCQTINLVGYAPETYEVGEEEIGKLRYLTIEQRFAYLEKLENKEQLLFNLVSYFRKKLTDHPDYLKFTKQLIQAEQWHSANVNLRAILEYLMFNLPGSDSNAKNG